ncbi:FAD-dependent oxidoreductase [Spiroplasma endosymbiont of Polydrusus formosus]|uniref:FAD-dependent oxidoreductase n=1 Tax=Spiroplasma endosymbiont of Polydrusus formosus TaxID=3139326 RepID=UPI0035B52E14
MVVKIVVKFKSNNNKVTKAATGKGTYYTNLVIWPVVLKSANKILSDVIDLDKNNVIKFDKYIKTSDHNIFAIGDCVEIYDR